MKYLSADEMTKFLKNIYMKRMTIFNVKKSSRFIQSSMLSEEYGMS